MKYKILFMLIVIFAPILAQAKLVMCNKKCSELKTEHIQTIKGLIYELAYSQDASTKILFLPHAAKTIVWMNKLHESKKIYNLEDYKKDNRAKLITSCVEHIVRVINGEENLPIKDTMMRWTNTGKRVLAEYKEKKISTNVPGRKRSKPKTVIKWKLELIKK